MEVWNVVEECGSPRRQQLALLVPTLDLPVCRCARGAARGTATSTATAHGPEREDLLTVMQNHKTGKNWQKSQNECAKDFSSFVLMHFELQQSVAGRSAYGNDLGSLHHDYM